MRLAVFLACKYHFAKAEAFKGAEQVEAVVLGFGFRMNDLRQLVGERHFTSNRPQLVCVLRVLNHDGKIEEEEGLRAEHLAKKLDDLNLRSIWLYYYNMCYTSMQYYNK